MLNVTEIMGFAGAGLAGAAYVPQISHLVRARCSAGISRRAFALWLVASLLTTVRAVAIGAGVFIALGTIQLFATALIVRYATRYRHTPCARRLVRAAQVGLEQRAGAGGGPAGEQERPESVETRGARGR